MSNNLIWVKTSESSASKHPIIDGVVDTSILYEEASINSYNEISYRIYKGIKKYNQPKAIYNVDKNLNIIQYAKYKGNSIGEKVSEDTFIMPGVKKGFCFIPHKDGTKYKLTESKEINGTPYEINFLDGYVSSVVFRHEEYHRTFNFRMIDGKCVLKSFRTTFKTNQIVQIQFEYSAGIYTLTDKANKYKFPIFRSLSEFPYDELNMHLSMCHSIKSLPAEMYGLRDIEKQILQLN